MKKDDGETLPSSAAYVRGATPKVSATFTVETLGFLPYLYVKARASGPGGIAVPETVAICYGNTASLAETPCTGQLPYTVMYYDRTGNEAPPFQLDWEMSFDNGATWRSAGNTKSTVYVTLAEPHPTALTQETLFYVACKQATGKTTENGAIDAIWQHFTKRKIKNVTGDVLTYYATYNIPKEWNTTAKLLVQGTSRCEGWAKFFLDVLKIHGIRHKGNYTRIVPARIEADHGFLIKSWVFNEPGTCTKPGFPYENYLNGTNICLETGYDWGSKVEVTFEPNTCIPAQGNATPRAIFGDHALAVVNRVFYDPSYGRTYPSLQDMEDEVIDGYFWKGLKKTLSPPVECVLFRKKWSTIGIEEDLDGGGKRTDY